MRRCLGFVFPPFRDIVNDAAGGESGVVRQLLWRHFVKERGLVPLEQRKTLSVLQAEDFIRVHQVALRVASRLGVRPRGRIHRREQRHHRHLVIEDGDRHLAAFLGNVLCRRQIVAAHIERLVERRQLIFPLLARILFLPLGKALHDDLRGHIKAADAVQTVRHAVQIANVAVFVQTEVRQHRQPSARALQARKV